MLNADHFKHEAEFPTRVMVKWDRWALEIKVKPTLCLTKCKTLSRNTDWSWKDYMCVFKKCLSYLWHTNCSFLSAAFCKAANLKPANICYCRGRKHNWIPSHTGFSVQVLSSAFSPLDAAKYDLLHQLHSRTTQGKKNHQSWSAEELLRIGGLFSLLQPNTRGWMWCTGFFAPHWCYTSI